MKKIKLFAIAAAALVMGLSSCNKDNGENGKAVEEGKESVISLSLHFPKSTMTRAGADAEAKTGEADVKNVNLFVYYDNGSLYKVITLAPGSFETAVDQTSHDYYEMKATAKISIPTGDKKFFVGINLDAAMVNKIKAVSGLNLGSQAVTFTQDEVSTLANGLPMFSEVKDWTVVVSTTGVENKLAFDVERIVAKVTAELNTTVDFSNAGGAVSGFQFAINNFNTKAFAAADAVTFKDPNWATGSYLAADFVNTPLASYSALLDRSVIATPNADHYTPCYAMENTSQSKTKQEITRATVRAKYVPATQHKYDGINVTIATGGDVVSVPATFYACKASVSDPTYYFYTLSEATAFKADKGGDMLTYTDGYCYWNIYLNKAAGASQWDVIRNSHFAIQVKSVLGIGAAGPEIVGPAIVTPDEESNLLFDVNVKNWKSVTTQVEDLTQQ